MENNVLIQVRDLSKSFGKLEVLKSVSVDIKQGEKVPSLMLTKHH